MSAGALRPAETGEKPEIVTAGPTSVVADQVVAPVSQDDFDSIEARLRSLEQQARSDSVQVVRSGGFGVDERELLSEMTTMVDRRVAQSDRQNFGVLEKIAKGIESDRTQLDERLSQIELEQQDVRQAFSRVLGPSSLIRAASLR